MAASAAALLIAAGCSLAVPMPPGTPSVDGARASVTDGTGGAGPIRLARSAERLAPAHGLAPPPQPDNRAAFRAALIEDYCVDRDLPAPAATSIELTVLDRTYGLPLDRVPTDLVAASAAGFDGASGARLISEAIIADLTAMRAAWAADGMVITIDSAYRSAAAQAATYESWVAELGASAAAERTARPGHSEHQLGTALDLSSPGWQGRFGDWATESAEGAWMAAQGWEFGFVMSYGAGQSEATCYGYEPWHYRWIGREVAAEHRASGLPLRTFLERYVAG